MVSWPMLSSERAMKYWVAYTTTGEIGGARHSPNCSGRRNTVLVRGMHMMQALFSLPLFCAGHRTSRGCWGYLGFIFAEGFFTRTLVFLFFFCHRIHTNLSDEHVVSRKWGVLCRPLFLVGSCSY